VVEADSIKTGQMLVSNASGRYAYGRSDSYLCVPACLNMIFGRHGFKTLPQDVIARSLGLVVPLELRSRYPWAFVSNEESGWGVHAQADGSTIDRFLEDMRISLHHTFVEGNHIGAKTLLVFFPTI
jgi:hypothetical protein